MLTVEVQLMTRHERPYEERDILSLASIGFFLLLVGVIWIITPNYSQEVEAFFKDFKLREAFPNVFLPAPQRHHEVIYTAVARFCFVFGLFQIFILALRLFFREPLDRIAGTISGIVFWLGAGFASNMLSVRIIEWSVSRQWFVFLGWLIMLVGLSLAIRSLVVLLYELTLRKY